MSKMTDMELVASAEAKRPAGTEAALRAAGDYYSLKRRLEEIEPAAESSLVPGAVQGFDITAGGYAPDVSGAPQPRKPRHLPDLTVHRRVEVNLSDFEATPAEAMTEAEWGERMDAAARAMESVLSICDFDPCLEYGRLQLADQWCHAIEWVIAGKVSYGLKLKAQIDVAQRAFDGTEIAEQRLRRLREDRRRALVNYMMLTRLFDRMYELRQQLVDRSGISFDSYRSKEDLQARRQREQRDNAAVARCIGMSPAEWEREKARILDVRLTLNGVEAEAENGRTTQSDVQKLRRQRAEEARYQAQQKKLARIRRMAEKRKAG